jgi:hypothetical protein
MPSYASFISTAHTDKPSPNTPTFDSTPPTIFVTSNTTSLTYNQTATITFTLSEASSNFDASDVVVNGGALTNFIGSGSLYSAVFTLLPNSSANGSISISNGMFSDMSGNVNVDGADSNNSIVFLQNVSVINEKHTLSVIVDKNVLGNSPIFLKGLAESITLTDGSITEHTVEYAGAKFNYNQIDSLLTTVTRNDEFTSEFTREINDFVKYDANISYKVAVALIGVQNIDSTILSVAGSDGNFVG